jgi:CubicO group peptidase (beta-lactamase class C family)
MFSRRACAVTLIIAVCIVVLVAMNHITNPTRPEETTLPTYWPTEGWRNETPEKLDLDSPKLIAMVDQIKTSIPTIDSVVVIRHGYVAVEEYFGTFNATTKHHIYSCTKSIVGTLIGIALDSGEIISVDSKALDLLPNYQPENISDWKSELTLRNLLMMSSGLDSRDDYPDDWIWIDRLINAEDAVKYSLNLNITVQPGTLFKYTNANSHLLSAILIEKTGMATLTYAKRNLFEPLGIRDVMWRNDTSGRQWGFYGIYMTPRDMAKIGYLYLHEGTWDGKMIVSREWVRQATSKKIGADIFPGYGYQWWVNEGVGYYTAMGYAGQFIYVFPEKDMVVVFTGHGEENFENPRRLVSEFILPAVK